MFTNTTVSRRLSEVLGNLDFMPKTHDRTSCSDQNPVNSVSTGNHHARCVRCAFIRGIHDPEWAKRVIIKVETTVIATAEVPCGYHNIEPTESQ